VIIILLSLDASIASTGYAIFNEEKLVIYGKIVTEKKKFETEDLRINYICDEIKELLLNYKIDEVVCENQFVSVNKSTILILRKLIGAIVRTVNEFNIEMTYYSPAQWRSLLKINSGKSIDKKEKAYKFLINNNIIDFEFISKGVKKNDDIVDAICIGIAYIKDKGEMFNE
jgi:crossover junction endodeoxyribonuclease RuvC